MISKYHDTYLQGRGITITTRNPRIGATVRSCHGTPPSTSIHARHFEPEGNLSQGLFLMYNYHDTTLQRRASIISNINPGDGATILSFQGTRPNGSTNALEPVFVL